MNAAEMYRTYLEAWSDVQAHLPSLYEQARGTVLELGTRHGISTSALLAGVEAHGGMVWSVDIDPGCAGLFAANPQWRFICADSCDLDRIRQAGLPDSLDFVFIDTEHTEDRTARELALWLPRVKLGGKVALHDLYDGSTYPGVLCAVAGFCMKHGLKFTGYPGSYGLAVIEVA